MPLLPKSMVQKRRLLAFSTRRIEGRRACRGCWCQVCCRKHQWDNELYHRSCRASLESARSQRQPSCKGQRPVLLQVREISCNRHMRLSSEESLVLCGLWPECVFGNRRLKALQDACSRDHSLNNRGECNLMCFLCFLKSYI